MKIKELISLLQDFDQNAYVAATWEGIVISDLRIYPSVDGVILIDVNEDFSWRDKYKGKVLNHFREDEE